MSLLIYAALNQSPWDGHFNSSAERAKLSDTPEWAEESMGNTFGDGVGPSSTTPHEVTERVTIRTAVKLRKGPGHPPRSN